MTAGDHRARLCPDRTRVRHKDARRWPMKALSSKQKQILSFLRKFRDERDYPPTVRDILKACGISSTSVWGFSYPGMGVEAPCCAACAERAAAPDARGRPVAASAEATPAVFMKSRRSIGAFMASSSVCSSFLRCVERNRTADDDPWLTPSSPWGRPSGAARLGSPGSWG